MASVEDIKQELAKAEAEKQKAESELQAWKGRYGQRLTDLENKLWGNEGTAAERAEWKEEKTQLEERRKSLEKAKEERLKQVEELQRALTTVTTQPGNDFVTRALGT
jgi:predicted  nucleic acid-binding Zn-ribbon protein